MKWIRECQECGNEQETTPPPINVSQRRFDAWLELKCRKCKSPSLDYGNDVDATGDDDE